MYAQYEEHVASFNASIDALVHYTNETSDAHFFEKPSDTQWSGAQIASHVIEAVEFWVADLQALLVVPGAKWGRNHEHVRRLAAVADRYIDTLTQQTLVAQLEALRPQVADALANVTDADLAKTAPSYNANFDGKPLSFLLTHLIIQHVASHVGQMERHLQLVQQRQHV